MKDLLPCLHFSQNFKNLGNLGGVKLKHLLEIQNMVSVFWVRILGFELQICISFGFGLRFLNSYEFVKMTFWCKVLEFLNLNFKFLFLAGLGLGSQFKFCEKWRHGRRSLKLKCCDGSCFITWFQIVRFKFDSGFQASVSLPSIIMKFLRI